MAQYHYAAFQEILGLEHGWRNVPQRDELSLDNVLSQISLKLMAQSLMATRFLAEMLHYKVMYRRYLRLLWFCVTFVVLFLWLLQEIKAQRLPNSDTKLHQQKVALRLRLSQQDYYVGEQIYITVYLENTSDKISYYVGRDFPPFDIFTGFHYIEMKLVDERNKEVPRTIFYGHSNNKETISEKLANHYVVLDPGKIYGVVVYGQMVLKPGRYTYTAIYHEREAIKWTPEQTSALASPMWTQTLESNQVTITVRRPRKRKVAR